LFGDCEEEDNDTSSYWDFNFSRNSSTRIENKDDSDKSVFLDDLIKELESDEPSEEKEDINEKMETDVMSMLEYIVCSDPSMSRDEAFKKAEIAMRAVEFTSDEYMISVWNEVVDELRDCTEEEYDDLKKIFEVK